jgi:hypothetical protein
MTSESSRDPSARRIPRDAYDAITVSEQSLAAQRAHAIQALADDLEELRRELPEEFDEPFAVLELALREAADAVARGIEDEYAIRWLMFDNIGLDQREADR